MNEETSKPDIKAYTPDKYTLIAQCVNTAIEMGAYVYLRDASFPAAPIHSYPVLRVEHIGFNYRVWVKGPTLTTTPTDVMVATAGFLVESDPLVWNMPG